MFDIGCVKINKEGTVCGFHQILSRQQTNLFDKNKFCACFRLDSVKVGRAQIVPGMYKTVQS